MPPHQLVTLLNRAGRSLSPRSLLNWAARVEALTQAPKVGASIDFLTEAVKCQVLAEAFDVLVAFLPSPATRRDVVAALAVSWGLDGPETVRRVLDAHKPAVTVSGVGVAVGRACLPLLKPLPPGTSAGASAALPAGFMPTKHALQLMERLASAVQLAEPVLLVGETGNGKTSVIQALATACGQQLRVQNLNVQSDSGDLFGGFRPVQLRQVAHSLLTSVLSLWPRLLSVSRNQPFLNKLHDVFKKEKWKALIRGVTAAVSKLKAQAQLGTSAADKLDGDAYADAHAHADVDVDEDVDGVDGPGGEDPSTKHWRSAGPSHASVTSALQQLEADLANFSKQAGDQAHPFAFAFVEGLLVKAARAGEWLLLDELNLAPPDTLQRLSGLLDTLSAGDGGLSLTERGDVDTLTIHPNFRVFAAMNPPTDYGKRDLPPALRNRFTEVFVDEVEDPDDLRTVVGGYMQHVSDPVPVDAIVSFFLTARRLSVTALMDGANQRPRYSLRTLCRALRCARELYDAKYPLVVGLFEGICMSFMTQLEAASADRLQAELAALPAFRDAAKQSAKRKGGKRPGGRSSSSDEFIKVENFWLKAGPEPVDDMCAAQGPDRRVRFVLVKSVRRHIRSLARAILARRYPVLLQVCVACVCV